MKTLIALMILMISAAVQAAKAETAHSLKLGDWRVTAVSDGSAQVPLEKLMKNISPDRLRQRLAAAREPSPTPTAINAFVIDTGKRRILVDTGAGPLMGESSGHLVDNLRAAGITPQSITTILLTHIHADHSGGLQRDGKLLFPNATVWVDKKDVDFWLESAHGDPVAEAERHTFEESRRTLAPVQAAGKLRTFTAPVRLADGIEVAPAPGHTPGSVMYRVTHGGETLVLWGDIIHVAAVQFALPDAAIRFDVDSRQAVETRKRILEQMADEGVLVAAPHIAFPGLGHVVRKGQAFQWRPL
ncbi:MBL fold metallo-hydrolase [Erwinia sp. CPCC 100877]|nr:MBL fold metallo-hydrolase [Erwinia sp. CPCC 100877]